MKDFFITILLSLMFCTSSFANSGFYNTKISAITIHDHWNALIIEFSSPVATGEGCADASAVILQKDHYLFKEMYAALLSAFHAQSTISGWANGCNGSYPILTRLDLRK
ncbi:hypothetical protein [Acinetobacter bereziniae]|uniref:hypothetical protein n=1 Tax=Acinetobacter bereziniae TaxID=106648 RepID=UPI00125014B7|nr:hypothetical protein [Acinetobacter bereziniae]MBJ9901566.1 hypothetical protein [Acinetobacter bereziniae]MCU4321487.1 hypothetical protein [Acinetobacter bereziniae]MCU4598610.1 hypothetical protein [Acinetobacter bereziniae]